MTRLLNLFSERSRESVIFFGEVYFEFCLRAMEATAGRLIIVSYFQYLQKNVKWGVVRNSQAKINHCRAWCLIFVLKSS